MSHLTKLLVALVWLAALVSVGLAADAKSPRVFIDPADAGPDFPFQGEYVGEVKTDEGQLKFGVQVIALGDGKFEAVAYRGGLPGDGWDKSERVSAKGERKDKAVVFAPAGQDASGVLQDGQITVKAGDQVLGTFKKVQRASSTLGAKLPAGTVVLFDGTSPDKFIGGRMTADGLLMQGAVSKDKFQDFTLHLEFRLPFQPYDRGQGRGNSGFYAQGRYEVQILDSFGLSGENNECGGIYTVAKPAVNMCYPPLSWQTYDVEFTAPRFKDGKKVQNAKMTVRHNGVLIQKDVEISHTTTGAIVRTESPEPGPVYLQDHGNPVRFRNVWLVEKK